jgi:hypothetical protein
MYVILQEVVTKVTLVADSEDSESENVVSFRQALSKSIKENRRWCTG